MVCPNPLTIGAAVVLGGAWLGMEIYQRWGDEIGHAFQQGWQAISWATAHPGAAVSISGAALAHVAGAVRDAISDGAGDVAEAASDILTGAADAITDGFAALNPF